MTARRDRPGRDGGVSLVELLIAMAITGVVLAAVGMVFSGSLNAVRRVNVKTSTQADLRAATEAISRSLRVAYQPKGESAAIVSADPYSISFYALMNRSIGTTTTTTTTGAVVEPLPIRVDYAWDSTTNCLNESWTPARTLASPAQFGPFYAWDTGTRTKCLLRTATRPVFSYFTSAQLTTTGGAAVPSISVAATPTASPGSLALAQRQQVTSVEVDLTATDPANAALDGSDASVRVSLENVMIAGGGS
jgi:prepilin-type N-terminal cleavage/methylation domain-containing protein